MIAFAAVTAFVVSIFNRREEHTEGFLAADRNVSTLQGAFSIAVSWVWAPAIFVCSMQAYKMGLPGIFWFTLPNVLCFFVFAPLALRLRRLNPGGYTLPEFIDRRFNRHRGVHLAFLCLFFGYQLAAIVSNSVAGGYLLHELSGISIKAAIVGMVVIALSYSLYSGLKASVLTDVVQMIMVLGLALIVVPFCVAAAGGMPAVVAGLGGADGTHTSVFDPWIAFSMGIPMTISLLSGPICDQMFFQRAMAVKEENVVRTFVLGGLIFGMVPITLSLLGFLAASQVAAGNMTVNDPQMVGAAAIGHFLPKAALYAFAFMAFAGLCSTLDSALCAASSLGSVDVYRRYINQSAADSQTLKAARIAMIAVAGAGLFIALLEPRILWTFFISGALAAAGFFPTILSLCWPRVSAHGVLSGVVVSLVLGTPLAVYANLRDDPYLNVAAALLSVILGLLVCVLVSILEGKPELEDVVMETV
ncbi:MAG: sodium:solute symporter [Candidatus Obscuribacterales bacterium]